MGAIPLPPKKTIDEHRRTQAEFLRDRLEPVLTQARANKRSVFFVDAAHFVQGSFLCCIWCLVRMFVRGASGRRRYNVLGAWNGVTRELIRVTNETRVSSDTMIELLDRIAALIFPKKNGVEVNGVSGCTSVQNQPGIRTPERSVSGRGCRTLPGTRTAQPAPGHGC
jgi:hypothetical protein